MSGGETMEHCNNQHPQAPGLLVGNWPEQMNKYFVDLRKDKSQPPSSD